VSGAGTPEPLSLDVIRAEVDLECSAQDRRSDSADSRAGLVLGFAGVIAGVALGVYAPVDPC